MGHQGRAAPRHPGGHVPDVGLRGRDRGGHGGDHRARQAGRTRTSSSPPSPTRSRTPATTTTRPTAWCPRSPGSEATDRDYADPRPPLPRLLQAGRPLAARRGAARSPHGGGGPARGRHAKRAEALEARRGDVGRWRGRWRREPWRPASAFDRSGRRLRRALHRHAARRLAAPEPSSAASTPVSRRASGCWRSPAAPARTPSTWPAGRAGPGDRRLAEHGRTGAGQGGGGRARGIGRGRGGWRSRTWPPPPLRLLSTAPSPTSAGSTAWRTSGARPRVLADLLPPGAPLLLCVMGPLVPWEWAGFLRRGEPGEGLPPAAARRRRLARGSPSAIRRSARCGAPSPPPSAPSA